MSAIITVGLDLAQIVFQVHGPTERAALFCARGPVRENSVVKGRVVI